MEERQEKKVVCEFCGGELVETGVMHSGNADYITYECKQCYKETSRCTGIAAPMMKAQ